MRDHAHSLLKPFPAELTPPHPYDMSLASWPSTFTAPVHDVAVASESCLIGHKDKYGRTLANVFLSDGTFLNADLIRQGYGFAVTRFSFKHLEDLGRLEKKARDNERGLWTKAP